MTFKDVLLLKTINLFGVIITFREFEQQRELRERGLQTTSDQGTHEESADSKESSPDQNMNNHINKVPYLLSYTGITRTYLLSSTWLEGSRPGHSLKTKIKIPDKINTYMYIVLF